MGFFDADLSYPTVRTERMKHKRRRLVQGPNSYFMDVSCPRCRQVTVVYSHATTAVECKGCSKSSAAPLVVRRCSWRAAGTAASRITNTFKQRPCMRHSLYQWCLLPRTASARCVADFVICLVSF
ncbi:Ribosomal_protein_S27 [Leishmania braziliensis MHOM/BR/75/M2904]|uniref:Ribosomal_protein_S27 n=1 Tax=Leishmania braziliensis MHOM/BR/75/M2904 TaxID=420245 RepID=A0A3P3ZJD9_LEIBR|nr:Ribosomal_protein_S27 [Leishmania braziliensis MHOM/BR/75/M2904]